MVKMFSLSKEKNFLANACETTITVVFCLIFLLTPLFFTGLVSQGIVFEKVVLFYLLVLIGLVAWITKGVSAGELKIIRTPLDLPIIATGAILLISSILSVDRVSSFLGSYGSTTKSFIAFIIYATFYYLLVNNINPKRIKVIFWSLIIGGALTIIYSSLQISGIFILPFAITKFTSFNPIGSSSSLAVYIASFLPLISIAIPYALINKDKKSSGKKVFGVIWSLAAVLIALTAMFALFVLNNFVFLPAAILGMVILLMFVLSKIISFNSGGAVIPIIIFLLLIIFLVGGNFNLAQADLPAEVSISRDLSWNVAKGSLKEDPLLGSGPATFSYSFVKYKGVDFNANNLWNLRFDTASGALFEMLANIGILGTFMFLAITLILISIAFISLTKSAGKELKIFILGVFSSLAVLVFNALFFSVTGSIILLIALMGALVVSLIIIDYPEKFKELKLSFRSSPKYALALSSLFLLISAGVAVLFTSGFKIYLADFYANKAANASGEEAVEYLNKAIANADYQDEYYLNLSRLYIALANQELGKDSRNLEIAQNYISSAIAAGKQAVELAPNNVVNKESLALIYENAAIYNIQGALEWAEKHYTEVTRLEPDNPSAYIRLALINMAYANREETEEEKNHFYNEAIKFYEQAITKKSNIASAYYGIAIVKEKQGDYNKAVEQLGMAVGLAGNNLDYRFELGRMYYNKGVASQGIQQGQTSQITAAEDNEDEVLDEDELSVNQRQAGKVAMNEDLKSAEAIFKNIIEVSPNHANAIYSLALIYESVGDTGQAKLQYEKLLEVIGDQETKDAILEKLRSL